MDKHRTNKALRRMADEIVSQCREEHLDYFDEAVWDMCEAVILADGLEDSDAQRLRDFCVELL